jgi:outer membrane immunogenic protein
MHTIAKRSAAVLAAILFASPALAADLGAGGSKDGPYTYNQFDGMRWTGFYFGSQSGWSSYNHELTGTQTIDHYNADNKNLYSGAMDTSLASLGAGGGLFGMNAGYDFQLPGSRIVAGLWGEYNWATNKATGSYSYTDSNATSKSGNFTLQHDDEWSLGGRVGYLVNNSTLLYGLAAYTRFDSTLSGNGIDATHGWKNDAGTNGYTLGLGYEALVARTSTGDFSYKLEGRYSVADKVTALDYSNSGPWGDGKWATHATLTGDTEEYGVMVGLNWRPRFNGGVPLNDSLK